MKTEDCVGCAMSGEVLITIFWALGIGIYQIKDRLRSSQSWVLHNQQA